MVSEKNVSGGGGGFSGPAQREVNQKTRGSHYFPN